MTRPTEAYIESLQGDFRAARAYQADSASPEQIAWKALLAASDWFANDEQAAPTQDALSVFRGAEPGARAAAATACIFPVLDALIHGRAELFNQWSELLGELGRDLGGDTHAEVAKRWVQSAEIWRAVAGGNGNDAHDAAQALRKDAVQLRDSTLLITATSQSALIALEQNDIEEAVKLARRASRMARTEALPQFEYLANWVLARVRRYSGQPHLSTRILSVLHDISQPRWHALLNWELLMAGRHDVCRQNLAELPARYADSPIALATGLLAGVIDSARDGDHAEFGRRASDLTDCEWLWAPMREEALALIGACDPLAPVSELPDSMQSWASGSSDETPAVLFGFVPPPHKDDAWGVAGALMYNKPCGHTRRALLDGANLTPKDTVRVDASQRGKGRVEHAACTLLGRRADGMSTGDLFSAVYGFGIDPQLHDAAFVSLMHRVRGALADAAQVETEAGQCYVTLERDVIVPDTRCLQPPGDRVLQLLARLGKVTAKEAADILGMPLRTVQAALKILSKEGSCVVVREGRQVRYLLEDTTFHEPTRAT